MKFQPHEYQETAMRFLLSHNHGALFLDMGLGKTVITLTVLDRLINEEFCINQALVIAPKKVAEDTWSRESEKWDHLSDLRISKILGTAKQRIAAVEADADVYIINRENVQWLVENYGDKWEWDALVIDELSSFKSTHAKRWRMLKRVLPMCRVVWGLTGTPAPNGYLDLYAEVYLLDSGKRLGRTLTAYRDTYFTPGARKGHIVYEWKMKPGAKTRIDNALRDICLSMSAEDWIKLPKRIDIENTVTMSKEERLLYDKFQNDKILPLLKGEIIQAVEDADHAIVGTTAATLSNKLLQMANGAVYDDDGGVVHLHDAKLDMLDEIREAAQEEPILVYYNYKHDLVRIRQRFPDAEELVNTESIQRWNNGKIPMLLCHPASVAYGLNLQDGGHRIVWFGMNWSLELYQQANARLLRQGQTKPVFIHHIITQNTMDERVMKALERKDTTQAALLRALKEYTEEQL